MKAGRPQKKTQKKKNDTQFLNSSPLIRNQIEMDWVEEKTETCPINCVTPVISAAKFIGVAVHGWFMTGRPCLREWIVCKEVRAAGRRWVLKCLLIC